MPFDYWATMCDCDLRDSRLGRLRCAWCGRTAVTEMDWELRTAEGRVVRPVNHRPMNPRAEPGCVRELCVQFKAKSIIQYTGLVTKDPSRGGEVSAGANLQRHQRTFVERATRCLLKTQTESPSITTITVKVADRLVGCAWRNSSFERKGNPSTKNSWVNKPQG